MAKATAYCTCEKCGKTFEVIKRNCINRAAANSFIDWAKSTITVCKDCEKKEEIAKEESELGVQRPSFIGTKYWNEKIYGYGEKKSIYLDNKKYELSDEELEEVRNYLDAKEGKENKEEVKEEIKEEKNQVEESSQEELAKEYEEKIEKQKDKINACIPQFLEVFGLQILEEKKEEIKKANGETIKITIFKRYTKELLDLLNNEFEDYTFSVIYNRNKHGIIYVTLYAKISDKYIAKQQKQEEKKVEESKVEENKVEEVKKYKTVIMKYKLYKEKYSKYQSENYREDTKTITVYLPESLADEYISQDEHYEKRKRFYEGKVDELTIEPTIIDADSLEVEVPECLKN